MRPIAYLTRLADGDKGADEEIRGAVAVKIRQLKITHQNRSPGRPLALTPAQVLMVEARL